MRILLILNAGDEQSAGHGWSAVRLETFLAVYYTLQDNNAELVLASPEGGYPLGLSRGDQDGSAAVLQRFRTDRVAREDVADMLRTDQIVAADFDAGFRISAVGAAPDVPTAALIATLLAGGKPVAIMGDGADVDLHDIGPELLIVAGADGSAETVARALLEAARAGSGS